MIQTMGKLLSSNKFRIFLILIVIAAVAGISVYRSRSTKLLDKDVYKEFKASFEEASGSGDGGFADQRALTDFIEKWADSHSLEYTEDHYGNIIFDKAASGRKKNVSPTLIAVSMNSETAAYDVQALASAATIALSDVESGRRIVVFFNDEKNLSEGYLGISDEYLSSKTKVIFLDKGDSTYISTGSFQQRYSGVAIPAELEENSYDTALKVTITGIRSGVIGPDIDEQPDPAAALSTLLTRLKSRSIAYGLSDFSFGNNGNMYPVSLEVTIALNSYNLIAFTTYIDKCIKNWDKAYGSAFEEAEYTYEVIDDEGSLPETVYTSETSDRLTGILYTINSSSYVYSGSDTLPEGRDIGDFYGYNCITNIEAGNSVIYLSMITQGVNDQYTERICHDNMAAAELYECIYEETGKIEAFSNDRDSLVRTFRSTYEKVNRSGAADALLSTDTDDSFTPCSYLATLNSKADIIHIRTKGEDATRIANTILCYIKGKGNTSIFK